MITLDNDKRRWGVQKRLEFIEHKLYWEGKINRSDLKQAFSISIQQASSDIATYQGLAPENIGYNKNAKHYFATADFTPKLIKPDATWYFSQLFSVMGGQSNEDTWPSEIPVFDIIAMPKRIVNPECLRQLVISIRNCSVVEILYQSFSSPEPILRQIAPHALAFDSFRWHTRAYCYRGNSFKDFAIARIFSIKELHQSNIKSSQDDAWVHSIDIIIVPHESLGSSQKKAIELDYGMEDGSLKIRSRICLLHYVLRRLCLDVKQGNLLPGPKHIDISNRKEIAEALQKYRVIDYQ